MKFSEKLVKVTLVSSLVLLNPAIAIAAGDHDELGSPTMSPEGSSMPMMGSGDESMPMMSMMQERHAAMQQHIQAVQDKLGNIEALLQKLVELQTITE